MSRKVRIEYPGAMYHVMNRGDQREDIFRDDDDREKFLTTLGEACGKTEWQVHAYCLMRNHFHLVLETPQPEDQLRARPKAHRSKVMLARRLRQETTMSLKWIAQRLQMGTWTYVSNLLNEPPETQPQAQEVLPLCQ
ncbi:MAG: transposase [Verrucomicrobia bacterium]|nr:transposase [Verrucomicrobiota bacterium]